MFFSSINGIHRLISKGMSNIYIKVTKLKLLKLLSLKNLLPGQF